MDTSQQIINKLLALGCKLSELSKESGVSSPTLSRVANGIFKDMQYYPARKLEQLLANLSKKGKMKK